MKRLNPSFCYFTILIFCITCKRTETKSDTGEAYFPLNSGKIKIFSVDSVNYNSITNKKDSIRYYVKEIITESNDDSSGYMSYKTEAYTAIDTTKGWLFSSYYFYKKNEYHVNLVKGGYIVTCFVFPVTKGRRWNMNIFNAFDPLHASYSFVAKPWMNFGDCVEVFVKEDINVIEESVDKRIYAREQGLVYQIFSNISIDNSKKNGYKIVKNLIK